MTSFVAKTFLPRSSCHDLPAKEDLPAKTFPGDPDHHDKTSFVAACHHRSDGDAICKHAVARANRAIGCGTGQGRAWSRRETQAAAEGSTAEGSSAARSPGTSGWSTSTSCAACSRPATSPGPAAACSGTSTATHASTTTDASSGSTGASHTSGSPRCSATPGGAETSDSAGRKAGRTASAEKRASANGAASGARERARGERPATTPQPPAGGAAPAPATPPAGPRPQTPPAVTPQTQIAPGTPPQRGPQPNAAAPAAPGAAPAAVGQPPAGAPFARRAPPTVTAPLPALAPRAQALTPIAPGAAPAGTAPHGRFPWRAEGKRARRPQGLHRTRPGHHSSIPAVSRSFGTTKWTGSGLARATSRPARSAAKPEPS